MSYSSSNGYSTYHYSQAIREVESQMDTLVAYNQCVKDVKHRPECVDGAYGMECKTCGLFYFRENRFGY